MKAHNAWHFECSDPDILFLGAQTSMNSTGVYLKLETHLSKLQQAGPATTHVNSTKWEKCKGAQRSFGGFKNPEGANARGTELTSAKGEW